MRSNHVAILLLPAMFLGCVGPHNSPNGPQFGRILQHDLRPSGTLADGKSDEYYGYRTTSWTNFASKTNRPIARSVESAPQVSEASQILSMAEADDAPPMPTRNVPRDKRMPRSGEPFPTDDEIAMATATELFSQSLADDRLNDPPPVPPAKVERMTAESELPRAIVRDRSVEQANAEMAIGSSAGSTGQQWHETPR